MRLTIEADRSNRNGKVNLILQVTLTGGDNVRSIDELTERAVLLHDVGMEQLNVLLRESRHQRHQVDTDDTHTDPAVLAATLDIVRSIAPTSHTPPERADARARLRAELIRMTGRTQ